MQGCLFEGAGFGALKISSWDLLVLGSFLAVV